MSVTLFEPALAQLLDSQEGEVGQYVQRLATAIELEAQAIVRDYFWGAPTVGVDQDIVVEMEGSTATVGMRDSGNKARRLAKAEYDGTFQWLTAAKESVRG